MRNKPKDSSHNPRDLFGEIIWPEEVLVRAREAVIAYGYAAGGEEDIRKGNFDHWAVIGVACHAICDDPKRRPVVQPKRERKFLTIEERLDSMGSEVMRSLDGKNFKVVKRIDKVDVRELFSAKCPRCKRKVPSPDFHLGSDCAKWPHEHEFVGNDKVRYRGHIIERGNPLEPDDIYYDEAMYYTYYQSKNSPAYSVGSFEQALMNIDEAEK